MLPLIPLVVGAIIAGGVVLAGKKSGGSNAAGDGVPGGEGMQPEDYVKGYEYPEGVFTPAVYDAFFQRDNGTTGARRFTKFPADSVWTLLSRRSLVLRRFQNDGYEYEVVETDPASANAQATIRQWLQANRSVLATLWTGQPKDASGQSRAWFLRVIPATLEREAAETAPGTMWAVLYSPLRNSPTGKITAPGTPGAQPGGQVIQTPAGPVNIPPGLLPGGATIPANIPGMPGGGAVPGLPGGIPGLPPGFPGGGAPGGPGGVPGAFPGLPGGGAPTTPIQGGGAGDKWGDVPENMRPALEAMMASPAVTPEALEDAAVGARAAGYPKAAETLAARAAQIRASRPGGPPAPSPSPAPSPGGAAPGGPPAPPAKPSPGRPTPTPGPGAPPDAGNLPAQIRNGWSPSYLAKYYTGNGAKSVWKQLTDLNGITVDAKGFAHPWAVGQWVQLPAAWNPRAKALAPPLTGGGKPAPSPAPAPGKADPPEMDPNDPNNPDNPEGIFSKNPATGQPWDVDPTTDIPPGGGPGLPPTVTPGAPAPPPGDAGPGDGGAGGSTPGAGGAGGGTVAGEEDEEEDEEEDPDSDRPVNDMVADGLGVPRGAVRRRRRKRPAPAPHPHPAPLPKPKRRR